MPNTHLLREEPRRAPKRSCVWDGWTLSQKNVHPSRWGVRPWAGGTGLHEGQSAQLGGSWCHGGSRKQNLGGLPAGGGGSRRPEPGLVRDPTPTLGLLPQKLSSLESTPRASGGALRHQRRLRGWLGRGGSGAGVLSGAGRGGDGQGAPQGSSSSGRAPPSPSCPESSVALNCLDVPKDTEQWAGKDANKHLMGVKPSYTGSALGQTRSSPLPLR